MEACAIGLVGWGSVGSGVVEILERDRSLFRDRCGLDISIAAIVTRTPGGHARGQNSGPARICDKLDTILSNPSVKVVVHIQDGVTEATETCKACLKAGKHVVTNNKDMLALHGDALFALATKHGVSIAFEAAVAGGVPIIAALRSGLVANRIEGLYGILSGSCNDILTRMEEDGATYQDALAHIKHQAVPDDLSAEVSGWDTAHKLAVLARIAFHGRIPLKSIKCTGIERLTNEDICSAKILGCRIKLLAIARYRLSGLELRVTPTLIPLSHPLASVSSGFNGIYIQSNNAGSTLLTGHGSGALPTASAILSDVVELCTGSYQATSSRFKFFSASDDVAILPEADEISGGYVRFVVPDRAGVLAGITNVLCACDVSVLSIHQGIPNERGLATVELLTHPVRRGNLLSAIEQIDAAGLTSIPTVTLRRL